LITEGVVKTTGSAPFPDTSAPPPPVETDAPDVVTRHIDAPITGGSDEQLVREATRQYQRKRDEESAIGPDAFEEQRAPVIERRYDGRDTSSKSLREATKDLSDRHLLEKPEARFAMQKWGWSEDEALSVARNKDYLLSLGYTPQQADEYSRRLDLPPLKIGPVRDDGRLVKPLDDSAPVTDADAFKTRSELKRSVRNFREAAAAAQAQILSELTAQDQPPVAELAPEPQTTAPMPQAQPRQTVKLIEPDGRVVDAPDAATPENIARGKLESERRYYAEARRSSTAETQAASQIEALNALAQQNAPELFNRDALAEVAKTNPARFEQLKQANAYFQREIKNAQKTWEQARASRQAYEGQIAQLQSAEIRARWHQYKDAEDSKFHQHVPEMSDPVKANAMRQGVQRMLLTDFGFGKEELAKAWDGQSGFSLRDHRAQRIIADAYRWRQAQANAKSIASKKVPVPPVQKPGTYRPAGADGQADIARLQRELDGATGARALKIATRLQQARRSAGM
jgi:hypothetical protein